MEITHFASNCPEVASSVVNLVTTIVHPNSTDNGKYVTTLKQIAFWRFDDSGAVLNYDAWIPNLALWTTVSSGYDYTNSIIQKAAVTTNLCPQIMDRCIGANQQYAK